MVQNAERPPDNTQPRVAVDRFKRRLGLLNHLETAGFGQAGGADRVRDHRALYTQTARMVLSPQMKAFHLDAESEQTRDAYGRNPFGQGCLLARRLVQAGVTFVEVRMNGWDTHQNNNERVQKLAGQVDPAFASLIRDLKEHGMLGKTLVVWMGEFGRTPKINGNAGRDHFPRVFNVALAGGGVRGRPGHRRLERGRHRGQGPARRRPRPDGLALPRPEGRRRQGGRDPHRPADQGRRRRQGGGRAVRVRRGSIGCASIRRARADFAAERLRNRIGLLLSAWSCLPDSSRAEAT